MRRRRGCCCSKFGERHEGYEFGRGDGGGDG